MSESEQRAGVSSPPQVARGDGVESELEAARRRLFELRQVLVERFDRRSWEEYLRLRRASRTAGQ